jgi:hypothetical protein
MKRLHKRLRTQQELDAIQASWYVDDANLLRWKRKPHKGQINDLVGLSNNTSKHRTCVLYVDKKCVSFVESNVIWFLRTGEWTEKIVEHKDGNPQNNSVENLRLATQSDNLCNTAIRSDNKTGVKGIYARYGNWSVQLWKDKKCYNFGVYKCFETAKIVRKLAEQRFHGDFARIG